MVKFIGNMENTTNPLNLPNTMT